MTEPASAADEFVPAIAHEEFSRGLPHGRFRVVVNPTLARRYVMHLTRANYVALALLGSGCGLALAGHVVLGGVLVAVGIAINRLLPRQAPRLLLHLAQHHAGIYEQATTTGVMEVRRAE